MIEEEKHIEYYLNGEKSDEGTFVNGEKNGLWTSWRENGTKLSEIWYKDGKKHGLETFYWENGHKWSEQTNKHGILDGPSKTWFESNGNISTKQNFKEYNTHGRYDEYHENGEKWVEGEYSNGREDGLWIEWDENGKKTSEKTYQNGELINNNIIVDKQKNIHSKKRSKSKFQSELTGEESINYSATFTEYFHDNREDINRLQYFDSTKMIRDLNAEEDIDIEFLKEWSAEFIVSRNESAKLCDRRELIVGHDIENWRIEKYKKIYYEEGKDKAEVERYRKHIQSQSSGCFIATATFGSPFTDEVVILKYWRNQTLLKTNFGKNLIDFYYWFSPSIAKLIIKSELLREITINILRPITRLIKKKYAR